MLGGKRRGTDARRLRFSELHRCGVRGWRKAEDKCSLLDSMWSYGAIAEEDYGHGAGATKQALAYAHKGRLSGFSRKA